ncbi:MAG TPA: DUF2092 domain-containing protein [Kofleriaceae bacterium]|nr:DUF2092 domain-containing protein [Kofleriaceae bacterium]
MRHTASATIVLTSVLAVAATVGAQTRDDSAAVPARTKQRSTQKAEQPPAIDPRAIDALRKMSGFLRTQQNYAVDTTGKQDYVLPSGEKVQLSSHGNLIVANPNRLRASVVSDRKERQFFFDGKTFTMFSPRPNYYTSITLPTRTTNRELVEHLDANYAVELPLADVLRWSTVGASINDITRATYIGTEWINNAETDHYSFRQRGLDWQVWIERGNQPLPRRLVLTTTDDPARPEYAVDMTWHLGTRPSDAVFAFTPPNDAMKIAMASREQLASREQANKARRTSQPTKED